MVGDGGRYCFKSSVRLGVDGGGECAKLFVKLFFKVLHGLGKMLIGYERVGVSGIAHGLNFVRYCLSCKCLG